MASYSRALLKSWEKLRLAAKYTNANDLKILYFRKGLLAIEKPFGLPVHNGPGVKFCLMDLFPQLRSNLKLTSSPELINRLDRDSSGIQLLSYNREMARRMEDLYTRRRITKEYLAVTVRVPTVMSGTINIPIGQGIVAQKEKMVLREDLTNSKVSDCPPDVKFPQTSFTVLDSNKDTCALLSFLTRTGYKHQIRVHVADALGCPILGDHKYSESFGPQILPLRLIQLLGLTGVKGENKSKGVIRPWQRALVPLHLHASKITIPEIEDKPVQIVSRIPPYFKVTLENLNLHPKRAAITESQLLAPRKNLNFLSKPNVVDSLSKF